MGDMGEYSWWSSSKGRWKDLSDMHDKELLNSYRKLERGDYRLQDGEKPDALASKWLAGGFAVEFKRRDMDPSYPSGRPEPPVFDN